jgi:hypothetical protein
MKDLQENSRELSRGKVIEHALGQPPLEPRHNNQLQEDDEACHRPMGHLDRNWFRGIL